MAKPGLEPRAAIRVALMDAIDERLRARCGGGRDVAAAVALWVEERNRVARLLGRPEFSAADLLVKGEAD